MHMNNALPATARIDRELMPDACSPEQRFVMAMLAAPGAGPLWGEPAALASTISWDRFLSVADDLLKPYLHWVSQQAPYASIVPAAVRKSLAAAHVSAGVLALRWKAELRQITETFRREGIALMLVKGAALQRTVYPDPSTRTMSDVDVVVRLDDMTRVSAILCGLGFLSRTSAENFTPWVGLSAEEEACFYKPVGDQILLVEIHTRVELEIPAYSDSPPPIWDHRVDVQSTDGIMVSTLEPNIALRHLCLHLAKHGFDRGLRWLLDIRLFVEHYKQSIRWGEFMRGCGPQSAPMIAFTLNLAADWLGAEVPENIAADLPPESRRLAVALTWDQMWDYERKRKPPTALTALLSGSPHRIWTYLRVRIARWFSPIPGRNNNPFVLLGKRLWSDFRIVGAAFREGGFRLSRIRAARRSDRRSGRMRELFGLPRDH
jgi:hypothetical protein